MSRHFVRWWISYLWRFKGVVCGEMYGQEENPALVRTVILVTQGDKPIDWISEGKKDKSTHRKLELLDLKTLQMLSFKYCLTIGLTVVRIQKDYRYS